MSKLVQGYAVWQGVGGVEKESDTFTCCHCQHIVLIPPRADPATCGGFCFCCMKCVCPDCAGKECTPFEKKLDLYEKGKLPTRGRWAL